MDGGNLIVEVDEDDIEKEAIHCVYDVIGRVTYHKGDKPYTIMELELKLTTIWKNPTVEISHIGKGLYHFPPGMLIIKAW